MFYVCTLFTGAHGFSLALSPAGHAGGPPVHHGASLGPRQDPWRVLWAFNSQTLASHHGVAFREARAEQEQGNVKLTSQLFALTALTSHARTNSRGELSSFLQRRTLLCVCGHYLPVTVRPIHGTAPAQKQGCSKAEAMNTMLYRCVTWSPTMTNLAILRTAHHRLLLRCIG